MSALARLLPTGRRGQLRSGVATLAVACLALTACGDSNGTTGTDNAAAKPVSRLQIMAPADPGGGWDSTARAMSAAFEGAKLAKSTTVTNVPGAGGTIGLAQLANEKSQDYLMVMGLVMVGAIETNKSKNTLDDVTPIARLTAEDEIVVVPAKSPYKTIKDLGDALKSQGRKVAIAGGSAGGTDHILAGLLAKAAGASPADLNYIRVLRWWRVSRGAAGQQGRGWDLRCERVRRADQGGQAASPRRVRTGAGRGRRRAHDQGGRLRRGADQLARRGGTQGSVRLGNGPPGHPGDEAARLGGVEGSAHEERLGRHVHGR